LPLVIVGEAIVHRVLTSLVERYPDLTICVAEVERAYFLLEAVYRRGGKVLLCGNGGSAADCGHIVGELMKGFLSPRPLPEGVRDKLLAAFPGHGSYLADHLQGALPAISLASQSALLTAYANDVAADMAFAQQVYGYGTAGDVVLGLSTSGTSRNIVHALQVGRALGLGTVGLTGRDGGAMRPLCDVTICVPWLTTAEIQERHLPIYHALCIMLEEALFP